MRDSLHSPYLRSNSYESMRGYVLEYPFVEVVAEVEAMKKQEYWISAVYSWCRN